MRGSWGYTAGPGTPAGRGVCFPPSRTPRGPPLSRGPSHSPAPACQPIRALRPWPTLGGGDTAMRQPIGTRGAGTAPRSANHGARPGDPARFERLSRRRMRGEQLLRRRRRRRTPRGRQRRGSDAAAHRPGEPGRSASPSRGSLLRAPGLPRGLSRQAGKNSALLTSICVVGVCHEGCCGGPQEPGFGGHRRTGASMVTQPGGSAWKAGKQPEDRIQVTPTLCALARTEAGIQRPSDARIQF
nr:collagen alpha-1(I) chain-like [Equus caballus]